MGTPALIDHMKRNGILVSQILTAQQDNAIFSQAYNGNNAKVPYMPFKWRYRNATPGKTIAIPLFD